MYSHSGNLCADTAYLGKFVCKHRALYCTAEVFAKDAHYLTLLALRVSRHAAQLGQTRVVDSEGEAFKGLVAAELRLDNRYIFGLVHIEYTLCLTLQRATHVSTSLIGARVGV